MNKTKRYLKIWKRAFIVAISQDMAYRENFFIKGFASMLTDFLAPIVGILIYTYSKGIPGWSLHEYILLVGTFTLILGVANLFFMEMPMKIMQAVRRGTFDRYMIMPYNTLMFLTLNGWHFDSIAEVFAGIVMMVWGLTGINAVSAVNFLLFLVLLIVGIIFYYAVYVIIGAIALMVVKCEGLFDLFFSLTKFSRYPMSIYGPITRIVFTFILPLGISAFYPVEVLLKGGGVALMLKLVTPVFGFMIAAIIFWNFAMKHHTSAGG